jgi:hypothetical protein
MHLWAAALCISFSAAPARADELVKAFGHPPDSARPHTFWHWMNGNITKEGITADVEAMKQAGIGGVFLFVVEGRATESVPVYVEKPVRHLTPEWFAMLRHADAGVGLGNDQGKRRGESDRSASGR